MILGTISGVHENEPTKTWAKCSFYGEYSLNVSLNAINQVSIPFVKYVVSNLTYITNLEYRTKTKKGVKLLWNV